jgi:hypothetical protein
MVRLVYSNLGPKHGQYPHRSFFFRIVKIAALHFCRNFHSCW